MGAWRSRDNEFMMVRLKKSGQSGHRKAGHRPFRLAQSFLFRAFHTFNQSSSITFRPFLNFQNLTIAILLSRHIFNFTLLILERRIIQSLYLAPIFEYL